jgi:hypothetical protein
VRAWQSRFARRLLVCWFAGLLVCWLACLLFCCFAGCWIVTGSTQARIFVGFLWFSRHRTPLYRHGSGERGNFVVEGENGPSPDIIVEVGKTHTFNQVSG